MERRGIPMPALEMNYLIYLSTAVLRGSKEIGIEMRGLVDVATSIADSMSSDMAQNDSDVTQVLATINDSVSENMMVMNELVEGVSVFKV